MCLRIIKHGDPVGDQRVVGLLYYMYISRFEQIVSHRISTSNVFFFPLRLLLHLFLFLPIKTKPSCKFMTTISFLVANK